MITATDEAPRGFEVFWMSVRGGETSGEGLLGAPDGSIIHLQWETPDDIHFDEVLSSDHSVPTVPLQDDEAESLRALFPDVLADSEQIRASTPQRLKVLLPGLEAQWEAWLEGAAH
jgi:hypothetical protein